MSTNETSNSDLEDKNTTVTSQNNESNITKNQTDNISASTLNNSSGAITNDTGTITTENKTGDIKMSTNETSNSKKETSDTHTSEGGHDIAGNEYHYATAANNDTVQGNNFKNNVLEGSSGDDTLTGGNQNDVLDGKDGNNTLNGGDGDDILIAGGTTNTGVNHINGVSGDDILVAAGTKTQYLDSFLSHHNDIVNTVLTDQKWGSAASIVSGSIDNTGGGEHTVFEVHSGSGHDQIYNFHAAADTVQFDRGLNGSDIRDVNSLLQHVSVSGNDLSIDLGGGNSVTLVGVDIAGLTANNAAWM